MAIALTEAFRDACERNDWLCPPVDGWTVDDLDGLPEDGHRRELIDGVLILTPGPTYFHQTMAARLVVSLEATCPADLAVTQAVEVRVNRRRSLTPDVLVVTGEAAARGPSNFAPHEVVLVAEIVSPGSRTLDRFAKPALYAEAGIPFYWRVETAEGFALYAHRLDPVAGVYVETGRFTTTIETDQPWPISLPVDRLLPRHFPRPQ